jgi:hypothetical protein
MCVDCILASPRIAQVDPGDGPPSEVVLSQESQMASKVNKRKYADEEEEVSTGTSKKRRAFGDNNNDDGDSSLKVA